MAKRTVSMADYKEPTWDEYTGEDPPGGIWLNGKVNRGKYDKDEDQMVFYISVIDHPDFEGWTRGWFAPFEGDLKWKFQEFLRAVMGGKIADVALDWENETAVTNWLKRAKPIKFQTRSYDNSKGEGRISINKVRPLLEVAGGTTTKGKAAAPAPAPEPEVADDEEALEDYTEEELDGLGIDELKEILSDEFEADVPAKGRREKEDAYKDKLIDAILDAQDEGEDPVEGEDGFEDGFEDTPAEPEPEPEPEPAPRTRRSRAKAAAEPAPEPEPAAPAARTRRTRR